MNRIYLILLLLFVSGESIFSQSRQDYDKYMSAAGDYSLLYKTHTATRYKYKHEGTFYAYSTTFEKGSVNFNGKDYHNVLVNYDACMGEVLVRLSMESFTLNKELVKSFSIGERRFRNISGEALPDGIYEVLYSGSDTLYKTIYKKYVEEANSESGFRIVRKFEPYIKYYFVKDGTVYVVRNFRSFNKRYPQYRKAMKKAVSRLTFDPEDTDAKEHEMLVALKAVEVEKGL